MQIGLRWLKDYVDIEIDPFSLAQKLTMAGLEVEGIEEWNPCLDKIVVAEILTVKPHPQADKLSICEVTDSKGIYSVVCGATNIRRGDIVPLAKIGACLTGNVIVKEAQIRGVLSTGMLCSEAELGIGGDNSGIMILDRPHPAQEKADFTFAVAERRKKELSLGEPLTSALEIHDTILTIGITPNRPDCLSVIGLAREIAALTGKNLSLPRIDFKEEGEPAENLTSVTITAPDLCPHYSARILKNLHVELAPFWMRYRLESAGMRSINNIVDVTNFVMLELGQPLHAFDYSKLSEGRIVVRKARDGERFTPLDGKERLLKPDTILICDAEKPVALGGIMGGQNSEVAQSTETVLLESAYFIPTSIRSSSKWLNMTSDASFRFERGVDPLGIIGAQNRAAQLIASLAEGSICKGIVDCSPQPVKLINNIPLRIKRVGEIAGIDIKEDLVLRTLEALEMKVSSQDQCPGTYHVTPPSFRVDISREIDLIEEVIRIHGYDSIPAILPAITLAPQIKDQKITVEEKVKRVLLGNGYTEVISYSFISPRWEEILKLGKADKRRRFVAIKNPLTEDQSVMRTSLLCGLLEVMKRNINLGIHDLKLFETGKVFFSHGRGDELPEERNHLACLLTGMQDDASWYSGRQADYYDLKGSLESIFSELKITPPRFLASNSQPFLHPGKSSIIMIGDMQIGFLGELHQDVIENLDLRNTAFALELDLAILADIIPSSLTINDVSRFPAISRDVALLITKQFEGEEVLEIVRAMGEELLEKVSIFDVYEGKGIPDGLRSLGLRFTYRSSGKTLTDEEITSIHKHILENILLKTGSCVRS